ncbi:hypothetical protein BDQ17DRAFT_1327197 [Cyathus striatus]|nr:hypothetical protein BDQ17DRAFT_1327197 [Cyathus striatus]
MPECLGFKAWISIDDDEALEEFCTETNLGKKAIHSWIPSEAGKLLQSQKKFRYASCNSGFNYNLSDVSPPFAIRTTATNGRRLILDASSMKSLGEIVLNICEVVIGDIRPMGVLEVSETSPIHERSKKGLVHSVGFAPEKKTEKSYSKRHVDYQKRMVTFVFKYRSLDIKEEDVGDDDSEEAKELRDLLARVRELQEKRANAKRVKAEPQPAFLPGEVIDLT